MSPEIHLFWSQKVKGQGQESQEQCQHGSVHSSECWLLLVLTTPWKQQDIVGQFSKSFQTAANSYFNRVAKWCMILMLMMN